MVALTSSRHGIRTHLTWSCREADVSAKHSPSCSEARFPASDVDPGGSVHHQESAPQGPAPALRLIHRVTSRATFESFSRSRDRARTRWFTVVRSDGPPPPPEHGVGVAFAVSRRVGSAVVRNRLRRQLRQIFRGVVAGGDAGPGWYLVVVRPDARSAEFVELDAAVRTSLSELASRSRGNVR